MKAPSSLAKLSFGSLLALLSMFLIVSSASAQTPKTAEQTFKNIQVLKGVPADKIQPTMWMFCAALGVRCRYCHEEENDRREVDSKPQKLMARKMIEMTMAINKNTFGGRTAVACFTCHQGRTKPVGVPLVGLDAPREEGPGAGEKAAAPAPVPDVEQILSKYESAIGGPGAEKKLSSWTMTGTVGNVGFTGPATPKKIPVDIVGKGQNDMVVVHDHEGDVVSTVAGNSGWRTTAEQRNPRDLRPNELESARLEDPMYVTPRVRQVFTDLRAAAKTEQVEGKEMYVVMARSAGSTAVRLYFDKASGLLSRLVYNTDTVFGPYYTNVDYSDYRDAAGLKIPYHWKVSRVRGELSEYQVNELKANAPVDEAKFAKPAAVPK